MEIKECPVCNFNNFLFFSKRNGYVFLKCDRCNLVFMKLLPSVKELVDNFYSEKSGYHSKLAKNLSGIKKSNKKFIKIINKLINLKIKGNLLDVGCSNGEFLFLAKKKGFDVFGVEVNKHTAGIAMDNGLNVFNGTLKEANFKDDFFSVIYLGDIIEHVIDPAELLKECKRILKEKGIIVISTPNLDCFWVKATKAVCLWFKLPWSVLVPPYHLFLFSESNFKKFISELNFNILEIKYQGCSLRHELGGTELMKEFREKKSMKILFYLIIVFSIYTAIYFANFIARFFSKKDFEMLIFAQNQK